MASASIQIPTSFGHELRAWIRFRLVKTYDQMDDDNEHVSMEVGLLVSCELKICSRLLHSCSFRGTSRRLPAS
ncbi:hypothetical protein V6N12_012825 [Hibiscus sabdariffa]|uniref:Uncharacterized protein n=1 Tax=Hibiscus sabdariffa TaxID=183260 RepID=A0ABR2EFI6_9ROSI